MSHRGGLPTSLARTRGSRDEGIVSVHLWEWFRLGYAVVIRHHSATRAYTSFKTYTSFSAAATAVRYC